MHGGKGALQESCLIITDFCSVARKLLANEQQQLCEHSKGQCMNWLKVKEMNFHWTGLKYADAITRDSLG